MTVNLKYMETIELPFKVLGNHSCEISENGYISIATTSTLCVYRVFSAKENCSTSLSIKKYNITPSPFMLSSQVDLDINSFLMDLPQHNCYEGILSTELSSELQDGSSIENKIIKSAWSPRIINDFDCILATLSNTGCLEIFTKVYDKTYYEKFKSLFNVTEKYAKICKGAWQNSLNMSPLEKFKELKYRIKKTLPTAFAWSDKLQHYCILLVAHACGDISFWKVNVVKSKELQHNDINFMNVLNANVMNISTMQWITADNNALLFVGSTDGEVNALKITNLNKEQVMISGKLQIWSNIDQMSVRNIKYLTYLQKLYVLFVKGSELVILMFDENGKNIDSCVFHNGNIAITGIEITGQNRMLVASLTGALKEIIINSNKSKINIEWRHMYLNINWYMYQCINLISSINNMLFIFVTGPSKGGDSKDDSDLNNLVVYFNVAKEPLEILLNNRDANLKDYWDCLEVFRCQTLADKQIPLKSASFERHCDKLSLYKLKLLLWLSKLSEILYEQTGNVNLIIKPYEDAYQIFNIKIALNRIQYLLNLYETKNNLPTFQLHNIFILNSYLKQIVTDDLVLKFELSEDVIILLLNVISRSNQVEYPSLPDCLYCGEKLLGMGCIPPHFDIRCSISFMQIFKHPGYKCLSCGAAVHTDIEKEFDLISCPYCDIPMCKRK